MRSWEESMDLWLEVDHGECWLHCSSIQSFNKRWFVIHTQGRSYMWPPKFLKFFFLLCRNTCEWKSIWKYVKYCLKTKNVCLNRCTKQPIQNIILILVSNLNSNLESNQNQKIFFWLCCIFCLSKNSIHMKWT